MNKHNLLTILSFFTILICSGCVIFSGSYETPRSLPSGKEEEATFEDGQEMLESRLDDIVSGKAQAGVAASTTAESASEEEGQTNSSLTGLSQSNNSTSNMPPMIIDASKKYTAILHTEAGDITIALTADKTPVTVNNFVYLSKQGFYDRTIFHRAIENFMIQGGDPNGDGTGGPGYRFDDEEFEGEYTRGTVAMANAGANTNGSQFFIVQADVGLAKDYVIFGRVTGGLEAVDAIAAAPVEMNASGEQSKPVNPVKINSVEIIEK
jgi:cyclophilin family peptidyl-prolyl cis-trans isomerase